ncbi:MAG: hypothetical protein J6J36_05230 [Clostridia bacterium]|nr:hypothetical protein [Clostridia bacterium]
MVHNNYIKNFYEEICQNLDDNYKIILEHGRALQEDWIEYDQVKWEIEDSMKTLVNDLQKNTKLNLEEKIFEIYKYICLNYIYDANVLYFFRRDTSNPDNVKYISVDWYGRIVEQDWIESRKKHNRRICYEFSRFYAKAINQLIGNRSDIEAVLVGDKDNTHYVVGLIGQSYSIILDPDDFSSIKDLTRLKLGLTIKGIHILRDDKRIFSKIVDAYNKDKLTELQEIEDAKVNLKDKDLIEYFNVSIAALNKYDIDSQGFFEYVRLLIESEGIKIEKIWKVDTRLTAKEKRHERCLYFDYDNKTYLLDSINKTLTIVDINELDKSLFIFNPEQNEYSYYGG